LYDWKLWVLMAKNRLQKLLGRLEEAEVLPKLSNIEEMGVMMNVSVSTIVGTSWYVSVLWTWLFE
jgi:hypothetical protein